MPTLLLADPSPTVHRVLELTFADEDVRVIAVSDGAEALARVRSDRPDIVLADVELPTRTGYEVSASITRDPALAHIPVLLLAGAFEPIDDQRLREVGCAGVLIKPFEPHQVVARVRDLIARRHLYGASKDAPYAATPPAPLEAAAVSPVADESSSNASAPETPSLDEYFARLDEAFAARARMTATASPPAPVVTATSRGREQAGLPTLEHLLANDASSRADGNGTGATESTVTAAPADAKSELADAFYALLESEPGEARPGSPPPIATTNSSDDDLVAAITERVMQRLPIESLKQAVTHLVRDVVERLVRDELARGRPRANS